MSTLTVVLAMLSAVALSSVLARLVPWLPLPAVQILVGCLLGSTAGLHVDLEPDVFFFLFLPPLLFLDGWRLPKDEMRADVRWVLGLATALVVCTVLGVGLLVHRLLPAVPLPVAFALAAVLSPTDPVAVSAIASRVAVPHRMMRILQGEALLNDASGLVCLRFSVAAAATGSFSLPAALGTFVWTASAGLALGAAVVLLVLRAGDLLIRRTGADPGWQVLVSLLLPFAAYLLAERIAASGILAAVGAGIAMTFASRSASVGAATRLQSENVWSFAELALNGAVFVLLGEQLPRILSASTSAAREVGGWDRLALAAGATMAALVGLRLVWTWAAFRWSSARGRASRLMDSQGPRLVAAFSLAGVRGAVTLAGVLSLPLALPGGAPLPGRDVAVFLAAVAILGSLAVASVGLPIALRGLILPEGADAEAERRERRFRGTIMDAAAAAVRAMGDAHSDDPVYAEEARRFAARLAHRRPSPEPDADRVRRREIERELHLASLAAARSEADRLVRSGEAGSAVARRIVREFDLAELRLSG